MKISEKKIINAIIFFASKSQEKRINRLKLMKLLWLSDRIHLNKFGRMILRDNYYALPNGPVPSKTMDVSKSNVEGLIEPLRYEVLAIDSSFESKYFSKSDLEIMEYVWEKYGGYDQFELRDLSHNFPEWMRYEKELKCSTMPSSYPMIIDDFFALPSERVDYEHDLEASKQSLMRYHSYSAIQSYLTK